MKKPVILLITAVFLALAVVTVLPLTPTALAQQAENKVEAQFSTCLIYDSPEDIFTNGEVTGRNEWHANIGSWVPLTGLTLTLDSTLNFDHIMKENLTTTGPPTYVWSFGDVPPETRSAAYVGFGSLDSPGVAPVTFTPGFDASRSADKTEFSAPGTQALTITVTPREGTKRFGIVIHADENNLVNPVITSPTSGDGIELKREGHLLHIEPTGLALDTSWTITVTIQVTPKVPEVEFMPYVCIGRSEPLASGTASGNSISLRVTDMGTWTLSTEGSYEWNWADELIRQVSWPFYSVGIGKGSTPAAPVEGNKVQVDFGEGVQSWISGDTFTNSELTGRRIWRIASLRNTDDETGEPIKDLRVTLHSELDFDGVGSGVEDSLTKRGPPIYEWSCGDLVEESQHKGTWVDAAAWFDNYPTTIKPGFDASRSFDKTLFTAPDTQTLTITVTPREEWLKKITVEVIADESNLVDPVIISYSPTGAENIKLTADKHRLFLDFIPVKLNTPLTITVTLRVTPKAPEVEYKPRVGFVPEASGRQIEADVGTTRGSSMSYTMPEVGTWAVSAEGNYVWNWGAPHWVRGSVIFSEKQGQAPEQAQPALVVINWQVVTSIVAGVAIIGLGTYFFIRRWRRARKSLLAQ